MPQQESPFGDPVGGKAEIAHLSVHGFDALHGGARVIFRLEQPLRRGLCPDLEVRQVYIHQPVEQFQRLQRVKGRCVVDDRQPEPQVFRVQYGQYDLRHHVLRRDQVDIVHLAHILQLDIPSGQLLRRGVEAVALVRNVVVLAEDAAEVAAREEDGARAIVALDARLLAEVGGDDVDRGGAGADEAEARRLPAVDAAASRAEVAVPEVGVGRGSLLGGFGRGEQTVSGDVVIQEEWRCEVEVSSGRPRWACERRSACCPRFVRRPRHRRGKDTLFVPLLGGHQRIAQSDILP